eukprot:310685-Pleurochrysis_carterae.AAC.5
MRRHEQRRSAGREAEKERRKEPERDASPASEAARQGWLAPGAGCVKAERRRRASRSCAWAKRAAQKPRRALAVLHVRPAASEVSVCGASCAAAAFVAAFVAVIAVAGGALGAGAEGRAHTGAGAAAGIATSASSFVLACEELAAVHAASDCGSGCAIGFGGGAALCGAGAMTGGASLPPELLPFLAGGGAGLGALPRGAARLAALLLLAALADSFLESGSPRRSSAFSSFCISSEICMTWRSVSSCSSTGASRPEASGTASACGSFFEKGSEPAFSGCSSASNRRASMRNFLHHRQQELSA